MYLKKNLVKENIKEKIDVKEPVILPDKTKNGRFELVQKLGLIERDVMKAPIPVDSNLIDINEAKEKVLKALSEKQAELQKEGQFNLTDILKIKKTESKPT